MDMFDADDDLTLREVTCDDCGCGDERLVESAVEVATVVGAVCAGGSLAFDALSAYRERGCAAGEDATRLELDELRRELHEMRRQQAYELGGLAGLDEFDEWHYDGPCDGVDIY